MHPEREVRRLAELLKALLRESGVPAASLSRELGRHSNYLQRSFAGYIPLKVQSVFEVLDRCGIPPGDFFPLHYPPGRRSRAPAEARDVPPRLAALIAAAGEPDTPEEWTSLVRLLLRRAIRVRGFAQQQVSEALGKGPGALAQALRGGTLLTVFHVFGSLTIVGLDPGTFFAEVAARGEPEGLVWSPSENREATTVYLGSGTRDRIKALAQVRGTSVSAELEQAFRLYWQSLAPSERTGAERILEALASVQDLVDGD